MNARSKLPSGRVLKAGDGHHLPLPVTLEPYRGFLPVHAGAPGGCQKEHKAALPSSWVRDEG